ncbi:MAG: hypothetical protein ACTSR2_12685 [Candidatus Hodarchaeales archaeon]
MFINCSFNTRVNTWCNDKQSAGYLFFLILVISLGLLSGHVSREEYLITFRNFIISIYVIVFLVSIIAILFGGRNFLITGDTANDFIFGILLASIIGVLAAINLAIPLLPSLFLGSRINKKR